MNSKAMQNSVTLWNNKNIRVLAFFSFLLISVLGVYGLFYHQIPMASAATRPDPQMPFAAATAPASFADLSERLGRTVVNVKITKIEQTAGPHLQQIPPGPFGDLFERFFRQIPQAPHKYRRQGAGSGVIISDDGHILTNNHVVEGAQELSVTLSDKKEYKAQIVGRDPKTDLAVLKIDADEKLPSAVMGDSDQLRVGDWVLAIGNPFGLSHTVTSGIVSAKGRIIGAGPYDDFIQTDASINPGNSGGPLFDMNGLVVGINTAIIPQGQGIGFAIPVNTAKPLIPQLVSKGEVSRGYLGVSIQDITPELAEALKLKETKGALVSEVVPEGPAYEAGIKSGDVIIEYNDKAVKDSHALPPLVAATPEGHKAEVIVLRKGKTKELTVKVAKLPTENTLMESRSEQARGKWGLMLQDLDPRTAQRLGLNDDKGVVIVGVKPGSPAALAGLRKGDVIVEINQKEVAKAKEALKQLAKTEDNDSLLLLVNRNRGSYFVALRG